MSRRTVEDRTKDLDRLRKVLVKPRTMQYLEEFFWVSRATVHRWLSELEASGDKLIRLGVSRPVKYQMQKANKS